MKQLQNRASDSKYSLTDIQEAQSKSPDSIGLPWHAPTVNTNIGGGKRQATYSLHLINCALQLRLGAADRHLTTSPVVVRTAAQGAVVGKQEKPLQILGTFWAIECSNLDQIEHVTPAMDSPFEGKSNGGVSDQFEAF